MAHIAPLSVHVVVLVLRGTPCMCGGGVMLVHGVMLEVAVVCVCVHVFIGYSPCITDSVPPASYISIYKKLSVTFNSVAAT